MAKTYITKLILVLVLAITSCKTPNELRVNSKGTVIERDSISVQTKSDSTRTDTIRYKKHVYSKSESPRTLRGRWYVITAIVLGVVIALIIRR